MSLATRVLYGLLVLDALVFIMYPTAVKLTLGFLLHNRVLLLSLAVVLSVAVSDSNRRSLDFEEFTAREKSLMAVVIFVYLLVLATDSHLNSYAFDFLALSFISAVLTFLLYHRNVSKNSPAEQASTLFWARALNGTAIWIYLGLVIGLFLYVVEILYNPSNSYTGNFTGYEFSAAVFATMTIFSPVLFIPAYLLKRSIGSSERNKKKSREKTENRIGKYETSLSSNLQRYAGRGDVNRFLVTLFDYFYFLAKEIGAPENASGRLREFLKSQWQLIKNGSPKSFLERLGKEVEKLKTGPESAQKLTAQALEEYVEVSGTTTTDDNLFGGEKTTSVTEEGKNRLDRFYDLLRETPTQQRTILMGRSNSGKTTFIGLTDIEAHNRPDLSESIVEGEDYVFSQIVKRLVSGYFPLKTGDEAMHPVIIHMEKDNSRRSSDLYMLDVAGELYSESNDSVKEEIARAKRFIMLLDVAEVVEYDARVMAEFKEKGNQLDSEFGSENIPKTLEAMAVEYRQMIERILRMQSYEDVKPTTLLGRPTRKFKSKIIKDRQFLILLTQWDRVRDAVGNESKIFEMNAEDFVRKKLKMFYNVLTRYVSKDNLTFRKIWVESRKISNGPPPEYRPVVGENGLEIVGMGEVFDWIMK